MLDRQAVADAILGVGLSQPAETIVHPSNPIYRLVEQRGLTRYPFDLSQAERLMAEAGWARPLGGAYRSSAGTPFAIDLAFDGNSEKEAQAVAGQWAAAGVAETPLSPIPEAALRSEKDQLRHSSRGALGFSVRDDLLSLAKFTSAEIGTPANRYQGANHGGYVNPEYDRLYGQALVTLDSGPRQALTADFLKLIADDVPMIGLYYDPGQAEGAARKGIRGPAAPSSLQLQVAWNIAEWEMD
jgi:peptide/nickel transport system substrate-binding protein